MLCFGKHHKKQTKAKEKEVAEECFSTKQMLEPRDEAFAVEYITSRLIALKCPLETNEKTFGESLQKAASTLWTTHGTHFKVWCVSRRRHDVSASLEVHNTGWPGDVAPPLEKLCVVCKQVDQFLLDHPLNVAVLFCKGQFFRLAIVVEALMRYNAISANDDSIEDRISMKRFSERYLGPDGPPSYKRYLGYFSSLLSGRVHVEPVPLHLQLLTLRSFPPVTVYLKVYERLLPVFQSKDVTLKETTKIDLGELRLRGDVFIKCVTVSQTGDRRSFFTCQLNTCSQEVPTTEGGKNVAVLRFFKEDLDLIFNDKQIDNSAMLELSVSRDPTTSSTTSTRSSALLRANSYESFDAFEDENTNRNPEVEYSEIKKKRVDDDKMPGPPVPPKPSTPVQNGDLDMPERRGVLPAQIRAIVNQNKAMEGRATPIIEPDLVGKDRYDKASRCFSYVPAKSMQEAFERPRRQSITRTIERREDSVENVSEADIARASIPRTFEQPRQDGPQKWDEQVENAKQAALLEELARGITPRSQSSVGQPYHQMPSDYGSEDAQQPQIFEQAQRAVVTPTSTLQRKPSRERGGSRYGSYRTLNDDAYCSDMDDLCDPDYYMNYTNPTPSTNSQPAPAPPPRHAGARSVQLPRRQLQPVEAFTDPLDDVLESTKRLTSAYSVGDVRQADSPAAFRNRHCQSVTSAKAQDEPTTEEADSWLNGKLKKVRSKRDIDPDLVRRRTQEKMLLEELKDQRGDVYGNEGPGQQNIDPLLEFRKEEERLKNTRSPYDERSWRSRMRGKPPTPPPREASASPVYRATPSMDNYMNRQRNNSSVPPSHHYNEEVDFDVNSLLSYNPQKTDESTMERGRAMSRGALLQDAYYSSQQDLPARFYSGQERVAAAIFRAETPHRDLYASGTINRAETPGRYFPENSVVLERSATPSFPVSRATPLPFHPLLFNNGQQQSATLNGRSSSPRNFGPVHLSRRSSMNSVDASEIIHQHPLFVKDTSKYWYKPNISREQAINMLRDKNPGTFVVRDSNSFPGAFGLALKVAQAPPGVHPGDGSELVRHFLIEPSPKGVKLKGCNNEPVFGSLSALVYQHSITALALPTKLVLPDFDPAATPEHVSATQALLEQGAACNVVYIGSVEVESLTGSECVKRSIASCSQRVYDQLTRAVSVHFKVSSQGVTLTDNTRKVFFRRHFSVNSVIFAGLDPLDRRFDNQHALGFHEGCVMQARMFGFVARLPSSMENACHVFAELEPEQPGAAVVNFINKVMLAQKNR